MTDILAQRKYRLAARLTAETAKTLGLGTVIVFALAALVSVAYREVTGTYQEFAFYLFLLLPLIMIAAGWFQVRRSYPKALANGVTRKEALTALALYGVAILAAAVAFTHLGLLVIDLGSTFRGIEYHQGFYGMGLWASIARPALYLAVGAAAAAASQRFASRLLGFGLGALMIAAVAYRGDWLWTPLAKGLWNDRTFAVEAVDIEAFATVDAILAALLVLAAWALLARAPMRPKPA